jgi:hypothetical protein
LDRDEIHRAEHVFWHERGDVTRQLVSLDEAVARSIEPRVTEAHVESIGTLISRELDLFI